MTKPIPRIARVTADPPGTLHVVWRGGAAPVRIDLTGWIARGSDDLLAPLLDPAVFAAAAVGDHGTGVTWDNGEGDLAIDAAHLEMLAEAQRPFGPAEAERWQRNVGLSNQEAADVLGLGLTTWKRFKAGETVPTTVVRLCRAAERDPFIVEAYRQRRAPGRPRAEKLSPS